MCKVVGAKAKWVWKPTMRKAAAAYWKQLRRSTAWEEATTPQFRRPVANRWPIDPWPIDAEYDDGKGGPFLEPNEEDDGDEELQVAWMAAIIGVVWWIVGINVVWWMAKIGVIWRMDEDVLA